MANIQEIITEVEKINPELARQIRKYAKEHSYGLVFEKNLPEAVRLYKKKPAVNDVVNILPERGKEEKDENKVAWVVKELNSGIATLIREDESKEVPVEDIVTLVSYKDVIYPGLKEIDRVERGNPDDPYHMVINSENYHALEALTYAYAGQVDCIYIDPPYNKKDSKDWKYNCDYVDANDQYRHSKWLAFMERRLKLAKKLLNPKDSVLIVTIDEVEYARLGLLLEQVFPEANIQMVTDVINPRGTNRADEFSRVEEYIFVCRLGTASIVKTCDNMLGNTDDTGKSRVWYAFNRGNNLRETANKQFYPIYINPYKKQIVSVGEPLSLDKHIDDFPVLKNTVSVFPINEQGEESIWRAIPSTTREWVKKGYVKVSQFDKKNNRWTLSYISSGLQKRIENNEIKVDGFTEKKALNIDKIKAENETVNPRSVWTVKRHNATDYGASILKKILPGRIFSYPKSLYAVKDTLKFFVANKPNALIIDFFAGSGTTLHAVNLLNAEDGGKRHCICVTNNEISESEQKKFIKRGLRPSDDEWEKYGIANYITWPRTKCTIEGLDINGNPLSDDYGCMIDDYAEIDGDVIDPDSGKKMRGKVYKKVKCPAYPDLVNIKKADGFKANAIFCELTYESAWPIRLDRAFDAIAPMLWMLAGCRGPIIKRIGKSYLTTDYYGVLFDYGQASKFCDTVKKKPNIKNVFVVTDDQRRYSNICKRLPGMRVHRLYESFLRTFEICGEGGLD